MQYPKELAFSSSRLLMTSAPVILSSGPISIHSKLWF